MGPEHVHFTIVIFLKLLVVDNTVGMCYQLFRELWQEKKLCTLSTSITFSDTFNSWLNLQKENSQT